MGTPRPADRLVRLAGRAATDETPIEGRLVLGRGEDADLRLYDETASRRHAAVFRDGDVVVVEDLGSANGTRVNGARVTRTALVDGDELEIGDVRFRYEGRVAAERPTRVVVPEGHTGPKSPPPTPHGPRDLRGGRRAPVELLGEAPAFRRLLVEVDRAAASDATVLVLGETGTGKELIARRLHAQSARRGGPFVALSCAAIVEGLVESELFGHERGAFTGADARKEGRLCEAEGGTLFLDEVGELSPALQAKLLRVLSDRTFTRVGGHVVLSMDCRLVTATHRDLRTMVTAGTFREDLWYRLAVVTLYAPPLRERGDDVRLLAETFLTRIAARLGRSAPTLSAGAQAWLVSHRWPGNVRELLNVLERAVVLSDGAVLTEADLTRNDATDAPAPPSAEGVISVAEAEKRAILAALAHTQGRKGKAAALLGISWPTLNRKLREYGL